MSFFCEVNLLSKKIMLFMCLMIMSETTEAFYKYTFFPIYAMIEK